MDKVKKLVIHKITSAWQYVKTFVKWLFIASVTGLIGGAIGSLFSICIKSASDISECSFIKSKAKLIALFLATSFSESDSSITDCTFFILSCFLSDWGLLFFKIFFSIMNK